MDGSNESSAKLLPDGLAAQVEAATGAQVASVTSRGGGGASREGAELRLRYPDGREERAYISHDMRKTGAGDDASYLREAAIVQALSGPLRQAGVAAAPFVAAIPQSRALITRFVEGEADFNRLKEAEERLAVGRDFMRQLAVLHAYEVEKAPVEGMGEVRPAAETVRETLHRLRQRDRDQGSDPLIVLILDWLERNIPAEVGRPVIVHGDAGPANFLFKDGRVTALLDWELVHYGDPMEDLAMICLRNLFQPFIPLPDAFEAYRRAGGPDVDLDRIRYYRLYFQCRFGGNIAQLNDPNLPMPAAFAMRLMHSTIHRHVMAECLAEMAGVALAPVTLPERPLGAHFRSFDVALVELNDIILPRLPDQEARVRARGLARLIKWWRDLERYGPAFEAQELDELAAALGRSFATVPEGRAALCRAIEAGSIETATAVQLCYARVTRDRALLADAMGPLADRRFAPLE